MWPHFVILKSYLLREKWVIKKGSRLTYSVNWRSFQCFSSFKIHFWEPAQFLFVLPYYKVTTKDNDRHLRALHWGNERLLHHPQANLGADQDFSPVRLKTQKGGLSKNCGWKKIINNNQRCVIKVLSQNPDYKEDLVKIWNDTRPCFNIPNTSLSFATPSDPKHVVF